MYRIINITFKEHIKPNMSCGTGYSEPDKFIVELDNDFKTYVLIDIWYLTEDAIKRNFVHAINYALNRFGSCTNLDEAFNMYVAALANTKYCPDYDIFKVNTKSCN